MRQGSFGRVAVLMCAASIQAAQIETPEQLAERLTPEQKQEFAVASQAFESHSYAGALARFKQLLQQLPGNPVLSKFASECALNSGDPNFALDTLKPIADAHPDDWQATALMARTQADLGDAKARDLAMAHMLELRQKSLTPPTMQTYLLERIKVDNNQLIIRPSFVPWGIYNVYFLGQLIDAQGKLFFRMTFESSNSDQIFFARQHPKEAALGVRSFSIDGYKQSAPNGSGQISAEHFTFGLYTGEPTYEIVREKFLAIAQGKATPLTSRSGLKVQ